MKVSGTGQTSHLLRYEIPKDIRKNWEISLTSELDAFLDRAVRDVEDDEREGEVACSDGDTREINFTEAGFAISSSSAMYAKKVLDLYEETLSTLEGMSGENRIRASKSSQRTKIDLLDLALGTNPFVPVSSFISKAPKSTLYVQPETRSDSSIHTISRVPLFLLPREEGDRKRKKCRLQESIMDRDTGTILFPGISISDTEKQIIFDSSNDSRPGDLPSLPDAKIMIGYGISSGDSFSMSTSKSFQTKSPVPTPDPFTRLSVAHDDTDLLRKSMGLPHHDDMEDERGVDGKRMSMQSIIGNHSDEESKEKWVVSHTDEWDEMNPNQRLVPEKPMKFLKRPMHRRVILRDCMKTDPVTFMDVLEYEYSNDTHREQNGIPDGANGDSIKTVKRNVKRQETRIKDLRQLKRNIWKDLYRLPDEFKFLESHFREHVLNRRMCDKRARIEIRDKDDELRNRYLTAYSHPSKSLAASDEVYPEGGISEEDFLRGIGMGDSAINHESFLLDESISDNDFSGNSHLLPGEGEGLTSPHSAEGDAIVRAGKLQDSYFSSQFEGEVAWRTFDTAWSNMLNSEQKESGDAANLEMKEDLSNAAEQLLKMRKWRNEVEPKLKEQEGRPPFLLDDYRETVFDWMKQNRSNVEIETQLSNEGSEDDERIARTQTDLTDIFRGRQRWEVGRLFVTLLLLRNNGNIDLTIHDDDQISDESFSNELVSDSPTDHPIAPNTPSTPGFSGLLLSEEFYNMGKTGNRLTSPHGDSMAASESPSSELTPKGVRTSILPVSQSYIRSSGLTRQISSTQGRNTRRKMMMELLDLEKGLAYKLEEGR